MLSRNLRTADSIALETCLVNQRTGEISRRTLEHTACTRQLQRLLSDTAVTEIGHLLGNSLLVAGSQLHRYASNDFAAALQRTMAIAKVQLTGRQLAHLACSVHDAHAFDNLGHLAVISTGVHINCAANAARNAHSELHAAQAQLCNLLRSLRQRNAAAKGQHIAAHLYVAQHAAQLDNQAADALIAHQQIRAVADERHRHSSLRRLQQQALQLCLTLRLRHQLGRTADVKGGMLRHRFSKQQRSLRAACKNILQRHYLSPIASLTTS